MNPFDIFISRSSIDFSPQTLQHEIIQNVRTICSTLLGTVPLDRTFGVNPALIDEPVNTARARISAQFIDAVRKFEPRAEVIKVEFRRGENEEVLPVMTVRLKE